ncbi:TIR domain-containing protein [Dethiosulfovibrio faecalis]|uniref:TIR domain-containing protein n=1 Tax=Dethiosulfovibrio faecalis TaxID=2720018 RepID=UPI001F1D0BC9|nr:TIR domain-containing protein [Dethiosulfovibrio faecalis]
MPSLRNYNIFISHAWRYSERYEKLSNMLNEAKYLRTIDYSVPQWKPVIDPEHPCNKSDLKNALTEQISHASVVIVIAGMWASYSEWIQYEIDEAQRMWKPILGIKPRGQERIPSAITQNADEMVGWNTETIVNAIRRLAR